MSLASLHTPGAVTVNDTSVTIHELTLTDKDVLGYVRAAEDPARAVRDCAAIGARALSCTTASLDAASMERHVQRLNAEMQSCADTLRDALDATVREYSDPDSGQLAIATRELSTALDGHIGARFDPARADSAIGLFTQRLTDLNDRYLQKMDECLGLAGGGPLAQLGQLLRDNHATQLLSMQQLTTAVGQQQGATAARRNSSHKGADFEARVDAALAPLGELFGDACEATGMTTGAIPGCKKGDFVVAVNARSTGGRSVRVLIESKDRQTRLKPNAAVQEVTAGMQNHDCQSGLLVCSSLDSAPHRIPFGRLSEDIAFVVLDGSELDDRVLQLGYSWARMVALSQPDPTEAGADMSVFADAVRDADTALTRAQMLKRHLGSITKGTDCARKEVDAMVAEVEQALSRMRAQMGIK